MAVYIKSLEIENYKCFSTRQKFDFELGFNLLLGANNVGKTSVMEALDLASPPNVPHASRLNLPVYGQKNSKPSRIRYIFDVEVKDLLDSAADGRIFLPIATQFQRDANRTDWDKLGAEFVQEKDVTVSLEIAAGTRESLTYKGKRIDSGAPINHPHETREGVSISRSHLGEFSFAQSGAPGHSLFGQAVGLAERIYRFSANRMPPSSSGLNGDAKLLRNASNLPFCINWLHTSDSEVHRKLCELVARVLPSVAWVQAPPMSNASAFQLQCCAYPPSAQRGDLAVSLDQMGAGVGNVIAILYVMLTSRQPTVICIDEPNQFLHPRALRELMQILATEGARHQYIISAHSAEMLTAVTAASISVLTLKDEAVTVRNSSHKDLFNLRTGLADLGIRLTELHGRDSVMWVEGQTEELVLPELLRNYCPARAAGIAVLRVHETGAFDKKGVDPIKVTQIHEKLTHSTALVPPIVCVLLDSESRKPAELKRLERESKGMLQFLPRKMLENYLLNPAAVHARLVDEGEACELVTVEESMRAAAGVGSLDELNPQTVNGAKLLAEVFQQVSESRVEFRKTRDVPAIVRWLLSSQKGFLDPLGEWLQQVVETKH